MSDIRDYWVVSSEQDFLVFMRDAKVGDRCLYFRGGHDKGFLLKQFAMREAKMGRLFLFRKRDGTSKDFLYCAQILSPSAGDKLKPRNS